MFAGTEAGGPVNRVPISTWAVVQRVNRKLSKDGHQLRRARGSAEILMGAYFITDGRRVIEQDVDLEKISRRIGVLQEYERIS